MATIPFWDVHTEGYEGPTLLDPDQQPWAVCKLAGEQLPGRADITGSAKHRIDVQKANGKDGGVLIERGYTPGQLDIELTLWTPAQWQKWLEIKPKIFRSAGKLDINDKKKKVAAASDIETTRKAALTISHPKSDMLEISAVLIEQITLPRDAPDGSRIITIKCVEYKEPTKATATRRASSVKAPPQDPRQQFQPAANKPDKPSVAGDGGPDGVPAGGAF